MKHPTQNQIDYIWDSGQRKKIINIDSEKKKERSSQLSNKRPVKNCIRTFFCVVDSVITRNLHERPIVMVSRKKSLFLPQNFLLCRNISWSSLMKILQSSSSETYGATRPSFIDICIEFVISISEAENRNLWSTRADYGSIWFQLLSNRIFFPFSHNIIHLQFFFKDLILKQLHIQLEH